MTHPFTPSRESGPLVATQRVKALRAALDAIQRNPRLGSPALGKAIDIESLRTWLIDGFPLTCWYFERESVIDVARLVGQREDALRIDPDEAPTGIG